MRNSCIALITQNSFPLFFIIESKKSCSKLALPAFDTHMYFCITAACIFIGIVITIIAYKD